MVVAGSVLVLALAGALAAPWRIPDWAFAVLGALAVVAFGLEPPAAATDTLRELAPVGALLAGVLLLAALAEDAGLHAAGAAAVVRAARGSAVGLAAGVALLTFVATALLSLDAAVVALTPLIALAVAGAGRAAEPLLLVCVTVANAASVALPAANPTNAIVAHRLDLSLPAYAAVMVPAALAASAATLGVLLLRYRAALREPVAAVAPPVAVDRGLVALVAVACTTALVGFLALPADSGAVALACGLVASAIALATRRWRPARAARAWGPGLLALAGGLAITVDALLRSGAGDALAAHRPDSALGVGLGGAALANAVTNIPATLIGLPLVGPDLGSAYALLVGVDVGPNLVPTASLATLLWLAVLRRRGIDVSLRRLFLVGLLTAPAGVAAGLAVVLVLA